MKKRGSRFDFLNIKINRLKSNRSGQFYIIAAIIIIGILIGIFVYGNYATTKKEYNKIYDLGDELNIETGYVYDYIAYGVYRQQNTGNLTEQWLSTYQNYSKNIVEDWIFIYGNQTNATVLYFTKNTTGCISVNFGSGPSKTCVEGYIEGKKSASLPSNKNEIDVVFNNVNYPFELKEGDILILEEFDPETNTYTGRKIKKKAKRDLYILKQFVEAIKENYISSKDGELCMATYYYEMVSTSYEQRLSDFNNKAYLMTKSIKEKIKID
jgi:hypothetical protein